MRLTKGQLKRIIREEYSRLKRRGLLSESQWHMNTAMGGPEGQSFPEGTTVQQAAHQMVMDINADYPGVMTQLSDIRPDIHDLEMMANGQFKYSNWLRADLEDTVPEAVAEALEYMDIDGSGNFEYNACLSALEQAINGRSGMAESRRRSSTGRNRRY
tara:strand:+ start:224 stop:697 length:474 start_codon:yes stop_codon:yes gene_type:complete